MLAGSADRIFGYGGPLVALDSWMGVIAFAGQIFFDFAGYSTCAIGAALCLGFHLKDNFRFPYAAIGFSDFWRRWHPPPPTPPPPPPHPPLPPHPPRPPPPPPPPPLPLLPPPPPPPPPPPHRPPPLPHPS